MAVTRFRVQVHGSHVDQMPAVRQALEAAGLTVQDEMAAIGVISGTAEDTDRAQLEAVPGVKSAVPVADDDGAYRIS
jgi:hypothetical protein